MPNSGSDVLIDPEKVLGVVAALDLDQAVVVAAVVVAHPPAVIIVHEVDIAPGLGIGRHGVRVVAHPFGVGVVVGRIVRGGEHHHREIRIAMPEGGGVPATSWQAPLIG